MVNSPWKRKCVPYTESDQIYRHHFEMCQWQKKPEPNLFYLCYRWFLFLTFFIVCCCSMFSTNRYTKTNSSFWIWLAFLTNWGYLICVIQSFLGLVIIQSIWIRKKDANLQDYDDPNEVPRFYKVYWLFQTSATDVAFTVTTVYWSLVYDPAIHQLDAINILVHAFNSVLMLIDLFVVFHPCRLIHMICPVIIGLIYTLFSYIYYACEGTNRDGFPYIYKSLDWRNPGKAGIFAFLSIIVVTVIHIITWSLVRCRVKLGKSKIIREESPFTMQEKEMLDIA